MTIENKAGYGNPPKAHQWQPGQSGNPSGKKKGAIKLNAKSLQDTLAMVLQEKVVMTIAGKKQKATYGEVLIRKLLNNLVGADLKLQVETLKNLVLMGAIDLQNIPAEFEDEIQEWFSEEDRRLLKITQDALRETGDWD
jgi:hypothetical protein